MPLVQVEETFKSLKGDLRVRPISHKKIERIVAHILVAFLADTLHVCLRQRLRAVAGGLTPRAVLEKFCAVQRVDVPLPTTDGREVILTRHTQPEKELQVLRRQLNRTQPAQPPPKITATVLALEWRLSGIPPRKPQQILISSGPIRQVGLELPPIMHRPAQQPIGFVIGQELLALRIPFELLLQPPGDFRQQAEIGGFVGDVHIGDHYHPVTRCAWSDSDNDRDFRRKTWPMCASLMS